MIDRYTKYTLSENNLKAVITLILPTWLEKLYILLLLHPFPTSAPGITVWELYNEQHVGRSPCMLVEQCNWADAEHVPGPLIPGLCLWNNDQDWKYATSFCFPSCQTCCNVVKAHFISVPVQLVFLSTQWHNLRMEEKRKAPVPAQVVSW